MTPDVPRETGLDRFREYLHACNLPVTPQRLRIADILFGTHRHVSADEILERVRGGDKPIGKATVYRTLDLLLKAGLIIEHDFGEGFRRYEPRPTRPRHEHLVCTRCGKVIEFESREIERVEADVAGLHRFRPSHHRVEIYGLCEDCQSGLVEKPSIHLRALGARDPGDSRSRARAEARPGCRIASRPRRQRGLPAGL